MGMCCFGSSHCGSVHTSLTGATQCNGRCSRFRLGCKPMRRTLSFLLASALLLAGIALAGFEITHAEALRPFVLFGAVVIIGAAGLWFVDEFGGSLLRR